MYHMEMSIAPTQIIRRRSRSFFATMLRCKVSSSPSHVGPKLKTHMSVLASLIYRSARTSEVMRAADTGRTKDARMPACSMRPPYLANFQPGHESAPLKASHADLGFCLAKGEHSMQYASLTQTYIPCLCKLQACKRFAESRSYPLGYIEVFSHV